MKSKLFPIFWVVIALAAVSLACAVGGAEAPQDSADTAAAPTDSAVPVEPQASPAGSSLRMPDPIQPQGEGMACFGLRDGGLTCLDASGWQTYNSENSGLPSNYLQAGALCPDGRILIAHSSGLTLFDGTNWENIAKSDSYSSADGVACAADGSLWVAHFQGVSRYSQGTWSSFSSDLLATGDSANQLVYDVAIGQDGRVWVVTSRSVAMFENEAWNIFQEGQGFSETVFFNALVVDSLNRPWAGMSSGAAVYDGEWSMVEKPGYNSPSSMIFDASGNLWVGSASGGVSTYNGNTWRDFNRQLDNLPSDWVSGLDADSQGRIWVGTTYGLVVFDNEKSQVYRMENSGLGDNDIRFIVVVRDGPSLPGPVAKENGSLTGILEDAANQPLSGMRVEICVESLGSQFSGETPCSDQPFFLSTETDANGVFTFDKVPAGYYILVAETGDGWAQLTTEFGFGSERTPILAGEDYDIGTLTLEE